jgi:hypothetical protein
MPSEVTPMLLGIHGRRRSGKDTTAEILESWCGGQFVARSQGLADDLKKSGLASLGAFKHVLSEDAPMVEWMRLANALKEDGMITISVGGEFEDEDGTPLMWTITGLEFWQLTGTEGHRDIFDPDFWVNNLIPLDPDQLYKKWARFIMPEGVLKNSQLMMVTDVRFPNEAERIKELGGLVLKVRRPEAEVEVKHDSEKDLPAHLVDEVIVNDEGLNEFKRKVLHFAQRRIFDGLKSGSGRWD